MTDLVWPTDPRMERRVVVSLQRWEKSDPRERPCRSELWWLRIGADGSAIEGTGRLTVPTPGVAEQERLSAFGRCPDGRLIAAYLARPTSRLEWQWQLRLAPVEFEAQSGDPRIITASGVTLSDGCVTGPAIFSMDGRWVYALNGRTGQDTHMVRYSVVDALRRLDEAGREADRRLVLDHPGTIKLALDRTVANER